MKLMLVKAASLYQVNTGLVTVGDVALNTAGDPAQATVLPLRIISVEVAKGLTVTVTTFASAAPFSHLLAPLTVT
ncbi:hypothetical protein D3C85_904210 [compost metagenome]